MPAALATLLGAFLLFFLQPFISKALTPALGGSSQVWLTVMVFFQAMVLAGYAYAHFLLTRVPARRRALVHGALLCAALVNIVAVGWATGLPLVPSADWAVSSRLPIPLAILAALAGSLGLPVMALAATSPLAQAWSVQQRGADTYRLYALSNLGSLGGLLAYPIIVEPFIGLSRQAWLGMALFLAYLPAMAVVARSVQGVAAEAPRAPVPPRRDLLQWGLLAFAGSFLLMAVSQRLATHFPGLPLLWVLPLVAYLLTFILAFEARQEPTVDRGPVWLALGLVALALLPWAQRQPALAPPIGLTLLLLFTGALFCHTRLHALRPNVGGLTTFYFTISLGGVLAGLAEGVAAPALFSTDAEWPLALVLLGCITFIRPPRGFWGGLQVVSGAGFLLLAGRTVWLEARLPERSYRDYYGQVKVGHVAQDRVRVMLHGSTVHGLELMAKPLTPTAYYLPDSGIARAIRAQRREGRPLRWGVVGLGVGNVLAHAQPGDEIRVYEISPKVLTIAGPASIEFDVFRASPGQKTLRLGDGRRLLEEERARAPHGFDILLLDAFNGGNVPSSLLTVEALDLYLSHLAPDGLLVFNVTNVLPLDRLMLAQARATGLCALLISHPSRENPSPLGLLGRSSEYAVLARDPRALLTPGLVGAAKAVYLPEGPNAPVVSGPPAFQQRLAEGRRLAVSVQPWSDDRNSLSRLMVGR